MGNRQRKVQNAANKIVRLQVRNHCQIFLMCIASSISSKASQADQTAKLSWENGLVASCREVLLIRQILSSIGVEVGCDYKSYFSVSKGAQLASSKRSSGEAIGQSEGSVRS
jgi:hypothetical protein